MRISDWSSDVCSSDLLRRRAHRLSAGNAGNGCRSGSGPRHRLDQARRDSRRLAEAAVRPTERADAGDDGDLHQGQVTAGDSAGAVGAACVAGTAGLGHARRADGGTRGSTQYFRGTPSVRPPTTPYTTTPNT